MLFSYLYPFLFSILDSKLVISAIFKKKKICRADSFIFVIYCYFQLFVLLHLSYVLYVFAHSVKYEDPQALGGLASALDVRQQNTGGVSALIHVV